jgi:hypothetical protein
MIPLAVWSDLMGEPGSGTNRHDLTSALKSNCLFALFKRFEVLFLTFQEIQGGQGDVKMSLASEAGFPLSSRPHGSQVGWI